MAFTDAEEIRIQAIETCLNNLQTAVNNLSTRKMVKALANVREQEIIDINAEITTLKTQIAILQQG
jgi:hypothetical protein